MRAKIVGAALAVVALLIGWSLVAAPASSHPTFPPVYDVETYLPEILPGTGDGIASECDEGDLVTGGGYSTNGDYISEVYANQPRGGGPHDSTEWFAAVKNNDTVAIGLSVYVVCLDLGTPH